MNALRHGFSSVRTVVPGEDPNAWEAHRIAVVEDVRPSGMLGLALAELISAKLWRVGRAMLFEANAIGNAQDPDELASRHEKARKRLKFWRAVRESTASRRSSCARLGAIRTSPMRGADPKPRSLA
jgi:hypothetical protein